MMFNSTRISGLGVEFMDVDVFVFVKVLVRDLKQDLFADRISRMTSPCPSLKKVHDLDLKVIERCEDGII